MIFIRLGDNDYSLSLQLAAEWLIGNHIDEESALKSDIGLMLYGFYLVNIASRPIGGRPPTEKVREYLSNVQVDTVWTSPIPFPDASAGNHNYGNVYVDIDSGVWGWC